MRQQSERSHYSAFVCPECDYRNHWPKVGATEAGTPIAICDNCGGKSPARSSPAVTRPTTAPSCAGQVGDEVLSTQRERPNRMAGIADRKPERN